METITIEFCGTLEDVSKWHDEWSRERYGDECLDPSRYYESTEDGRFVYPDAPKVGLEIHDEKENRDKVLELLLRLRHINMELKGALTPQGTKPRKHLTSNEREKLRNEREDVYKMFCKKAGYDGCNDVATEPQQIQKQAPKEIPTINGTDNERLVFGNALQKQYMSISNGCYKWTTSKSLLAYMCGRLYCGDKVCEDRNDTDHMIYKKGNTQMPATNVKALFGVDVASNRYQIKDKGNPPRGHWKIDELFNGTGANG